MKTINYTGVVNFIKLEQINKRLMFSSSKSLFTKTKNFLIKKETQTANKV